MQPNDAQPCLDLKAVQGGWYSSVFILHYELQMQFHCDCLTHQQPPVSTSQLRQCWFLNFKKWTGPDLGPKLTPWQSSSETHVEIIYTNISCQQDSLHIHSMDHTRVTVRKQCQLNQKPMWSHNWLGSNHLCQQCSRAFCTSGPMTCHTNGPWENKID